MLSHETVHQNRPKLVATEMTLNSQKCFITLYIVGWVITRIVKRLPLNHVRIFCYGINYDRFLQIVQAQIRLLESSLFAILSASLKLAILSASL